MTNATVERIFSELTNRRIAALSNEAGEAGDLAAVVVCTAALEGDPTARREVARTRGAQLYSVRSLWRHSLRGVRRR